jgi:6-phosphofructokinase
MATKELYIVIVNGGDGSYSSQYTFNKEFIDKMEKMEAESDPDFDYESYSDGDGFHYDVLTVPEECTLESLGVTYDFAKDW